MVWLRETSIMIVVNSTTGKYNSKTALERLIYQKALAIRTAVTSWIEK